MWREIYILWTLVITTKCNEIRALDSPSPNFLLQIRLAQLLELCFADRLNPLAVTSDLLDVVHLIPRDELDPPVMIIDGNYKPSSIQLFNSAYPTHILSTDSLINLKALLNQLSSSSFWSALSLFLVVGSNENSCKLASSVLQALWKKDLLSCFFVCHNAGNNTMLFTFNPFTSRAPQPWTKVELANKPDNRWTLYQQLFVNDKKICSSLIFDKAKFVDGYEIKAVGFPLKNPNWDRNKDYEVASLKKYMLYENAIYMINLFSALNVTAVINYDDSDNYRKNISIGFLRKLVQGTHDMALNNRFLDYIGNKESDPVVGIVTSYNQLTFLIVTQERKFVKSINEIGNFFYPQSAILSITILVLIFIIILSRNRYDYGISFLEILRLTLNMGLNTPFDTLSMLMVFFGANVFAFVFNPALQGYIFAMLAKSEYRNVENLQDLHDYGYHLHYHVAIHEDMAASKMWNDQEIEQYLRPELKFNATRCHEEIIRNPFVGCIALTVRQIEGAAKYNFYVSKELRNQKYAVNWVRKNWPLKSRVDQVALRFSEAGLIYFWEKKVSTDVLKKLRRSQSIEKAERYDLIDENEMKFFYVLMALSFIWAIFNFAFEVLIDQLKRHSQQ